MFEVVVIGGGPAGVTAALRARELGAGVALVEANAAASVRPLLSEEDLHFIQEVSPL